MLTEALLALIAFLLTKILWILNEIKTSNEIENDKINPPLPPAPPVPSAPPTPVKELPPPYTEHATPVPSAQPAILSLFAHEAKETRNLNEFMHNRHPTVA
jgi:hypothetical protein